MSTELVVGLSSAVVAAVAALLTYHAATRSQRVSRMARMERRQDVLEYRNRRLWMYCRQLVDHIYQHKPPPPPAWPDDLDDDEDAQPA
ncbi:hypothetical protein ACQP60_04150 [Isoptericola variabilis]|uniref:hypothetical protein n=1 Tax=Isoptericola variabilis TaxID=139208 RepID=UPI003D1A75F0